jgi:hypothetical protein
MLSVFMLNVVMLNVVMISVVAGLSSTKKCDQNHISHIYEAGLAGAFIQQTCLSLIGYF